MTANKLEGKARDMHSCSYYCDRPECVKAQRDQLREAYVVRGREYPNEAARQSEGMVLVPRVTLELAAESAHPQQVRDFAAGLLAAAPADAGEG